MCGVYHWRSVLRNIIFRADKVHHSDPNFIVPRGSDVHMWISWLQAFDLIRSTTIIVLYPNNLPKQQRRSVFDEPDHI